MRYARVKHENNLLERSRRILSVLGASKLNKTAIARNSIQFEIFNQYPPVYLLGPIKNPDSIFLPHGDFGLPGVCKPLALYVHIPFCLKRCTFCRYFSIDKWPADFINKYLHYLEKEMGLLSKKEYFMGKKINSVHLGGGTPTLLSKRQIGKLMNGIKDNFRIIAGAEFTVEATPESLTSRRLDYFRGYGFNRLSIGIQTFDDRILKSLKRLYTAKQAISVFNLAKDSGFSNINIDLLFGLAGQDLHSWGESLEMAAGLGAASVTAYPFTACFGRGEAPVLENVSDRPEEERLLMHIMTIEKFTRLGYIQITPYQFIRSSRCTFKQQEHKAQNGEIYALGVTGHSFVNNVEFHNHRTLRGYENMLAKGSIPVEVGRRLNKEEQMIRFVIYGLQKRAGLNRKDAGVDKILFTRMFGISVEDKFGAKLKELLRLGLIRDTGRYLRLSHLGLLYHTEMCTFFYLEKDKKNLVPFMVQ